jgi:hypothetical protein
MRNNHKNGIKTAGNLGQGDLALEVPDPCSILSTGPSTRDGRKDGQEVALRAPSKNHSHSGKPPPGLAQATQDSPCQKQSLGNQFDDLERRKL